MIFFYLKIRIQKIMCFNWNSISYCIDRVNITISFTAHYRTYYSENSRQQSCVSVHGRQRPCVGSRRQQSHETDGGQLVLRFKVGNCALVTRRRRYCFLQELLLIILSLSFMFCTPLRFVPLKSRQSLHRSCLTEARAWARGVFWCWWQSVTENRIYCN